MSFADGNLLYWQHKFYDTCFHLTNFVADGKLFYSGSTIPKTFFLLFLTVHQYNIFVMVQFSNQFTFLKLVYFFKTGFIFLSIKIEFSAVCSDSKSHILRSGIQILIPCRTGLNFSALLSEAVRSSE